jgi:hypothetical protein
MDTTEISTPVVDLATPPTPAETEPAVPQPKLVDPPAQKKLSKLQIKKMQQYQERRRRLLNKGVPEAQVDAVIAREDYEALPVGDKLKRLEGFIASALGQLGQEITALRENDQVLSEAMDVNFTAVARALVKLGVPLEEQRAIIDAVNAEIEEAMEKRKAAAKKAQDEANQKAAAQNLAAQAEEAGEPPPPPEEATQFGG